MHIAPNEAGPMVTGDRFLQRKRTEQKQVVTENHFITASLNLRRPTVI